LIDNIKEDHFTEFLGQQIVRHQPINSKRAERVFKLMVIRTFGSIKNTSKSDPWVYKYQY